MTSPSPEDRHAALEQLRTADRIVAGVLGSMRTMQREQVVDALGGIDASEGFFGGPAADDAAAAQLQLNEAEAHVRRAAKQMGMHAEHGPGAELTAPGALEAAFDGMFDVLAVARANRNVAATQDLHRRLRAMFAGIRAEVPELDIEPLAEWDDGGFVGGVVEELEAAAKFKRPQLIFIGVIVAGVLGLGIWGWMTARAMLAEVEVAAEPVIQAVVVDDPERFAALVELGDAELEAEAFAALREELGAEHGALTQIDCHEVNQSGSRTRAHCKATFEAGVPLALAITINGERTVSLSLGDVTVGSP